MAGETFNSLMSSPWTPAGARPMAQASGAPASMFQSAYATLLGMGRKTPLAGSMPESMGGGAMPGTTPQAPIAAGGVGVDAPKQPGTVVPPPGPVAGPVSKREGRGGVQYQSVGASKRGAM